MTKLEKFYFQVNKEVVSTPFAILFVVALLAVCTLGCGGKETPVGPSPVPTPSVLTITPMSVKMVPTQTQVFTASEAVTWNVLPASCGTVNPASGMTTTYTPANVSANCNVAGTTLDGKQVQRPVVQVFNTPSIRYVSSNPDLMSGATLTAGQDVSITVEYVALTSSPSPVTAMFRDATGHGFGGGGSAPPSPGKGVWTWTFNSHLTPPASPTRVELVLDDPPYPRQEVPTNLTWK